MIFIGNEQAIPLSLTPFNVEWGTNSTSWTSSNKLGICSSYFGRSMMYTPWDGANNILKSYDRYYDKDNNTIDDLLNVYDIPDTRVFTAYPTRWKMENLIKFRTYYDEDYDEYRRLSYTYLNASKLTYDDDAEFDYQGWSVYAKNAHEDSFWNRTYTINGALPYYTDKLYARSYMIFLMEGPDTTIDLSTYRMGFNLWANGNLGEPIDPDIWEWGDREGWDPLSGENEVSEGGIRKSTGGDSVSGPIRGGGDTPVDPGYPDEDLSNATGYSGFQYKLVRSHRTTINGKKYAYLFAKSRNYPNIYDVYDRGMGSGNLRTVSAPMLNLSTIFSSYRQICDKLYILESGYEYVWNL